METGQIRTALLKGVDKEQTLARIEALTTLADAVQRGSMFREQAIEEAERIAGEPFRTQMGGFREDDVNACLHELIQRL